MIKAKTKDTIYLGLSDENLRRLKNNEPILFNLKELGLMDMDVLIFNGTTEDVMYSMIKHKLHPTKTVFKHDRPEQN